MSGLVLSFSRPAAAAMTATTEGSGSDGERLEHHVLTPGERW